MTATIIPLVSFDGQDGSDPVGGLIEDANGDLFGTTETGGYYGSGEVFEIAKTATGYASTPTPLVSFSDTGGEGANPAAGLMFDADGNLLGTTVDGGFDNDGTVFEIAKTATGYASTPTTLVSFDGTDGARPYGSLIHDADGNVFGTTESGGEYGYGEVFAIAKTNGTLGYISFDDSDGAYPTGNLIISPSGDLYGTTGAGGTRGDGTVFEIADTANGYVGPPNTLAYFAGLDGSEPGGGLIILNGDLFGTAAMAGEQPSLAPGDGTVFEVSNSLITLATFNGSDGSVPAASLLADADGDLFGTTTAGGDGFPTTSGFGTVFVIANSASGYSSTVDYVAFDGNNGADPSSSLIADANGDLFGTAQQGGAYKDGTVFEVTSTGFVPPTSVQPGGNASAILWRNTAGDVELWSPNGSGGFTYDNLGVVNSSWQVAGTGDFNGDGEDGILWRNTNGGVEIWNSNGSGGFTYDSLGTVNSSWQVAGTGDFNGDGEDGILWRDTNGGVEIWNSNGSGGFAYDNLGSVNTSWQIAGTGDFNGDGEDGILWRNTNGAVEIWNSNGSGGFTYDSLGTVNSSWQVAGTGDFNGNGEDSILWRNTNGGVEIWNSNGSEGFTYENLGLVNSSWKIQGTGDFTGNGEDGILWRNSSTGDLELWNPNGSGGFTYENLGVVNTSWSVQKIFA